MEPVHEHWSAKATTAAVPELRRAVSEFALAAGVRSAPLESVRSCVTEATTNAVLHAYRDGRAPGTIHVSAQLRDDRIVLTVSDDGTGHSPRADSPGLGIGLSLIATLCDSVSIETSDRGGSEIRMVISLEGSEPAALPTGAAGPASITSGAGRAGVSR